MIRKPIEVSKKNSKSIDLWFDCYVIFWFIFPTNQTPTYHLRARSFYLMISSGSEIFNKLSSQLTDDIYGCASMLVSLYKHRKTFRSLDPSHQKKKKNLYNSLIPLLYHAQFYLFIFRGCLFIGWLFLVLLLKI